MKILCVGYREWSLKIYKNIKRRKTHKFYYHLELKGLEKKIKKIRPNIILFYGWSWKIKRAIYSNFKCFMLHPSKLPKFRGGSPIQNQIIRGVEKSAVTIFKINEIIDGGDIYFQKQLLLNGTLESIFDRIIKIGIIGTNKILYQKNLIKKPQNHQIATFYKRRKPKDSEISGDELKKKSKKYIINKIRMLVDPYPNAFIKYNGKKIIIKKIDIQ